MDDPNSIYFQYDPSSIGWLHRRAEKGEPVLNSDLVRIIEANPGLVPDDTLRDHVIRGLTRPLPAKRGRQRKASKVLLDRYIVATYEDLLPRLQKRMARERDGRRKVRGSRGPAELLCELIGNRFGMEPESVRNLVSSHNMRRE